MSCVRTFVAVVALLCCLVYHAAAGTSHRGWPECDTSVVQSSGYIDIPGKAGTQKHYFYWLFGPRRWPADGSAPPVIMWMTGGPGCSSNLALMTELGPCMMNETTGKLYRNAYGWNDEAYLLFVEQTAGVGYSYADEANWDHNESEAAEDMYQFLQAFSRKFTSPSITGANDFYVIGESYGGHYVPSVGYRILQGNQEGKNPHINLKGIAVGNGLTDPYTQYPAYAEMAWEGCQRQIGKTCVSEATHKDMLARLPGCLDLIAACNAEATDQNDACAQAYDVCTTYVYLYKEYNLNNYDIRKLCEGDLCYPMDNTIAFFRRQDVMTSLGARTDTVWSTCNGDVGALFHRDYHRNFNYTVPPMLEAGIRVLIYAGDMDYVCNWIGNKAWVTALNWPGKAGFNAAPDVEFAVGGRSAGQERKYGDFSFVRLYDAGHMAPMDQPEASLYMVRQFLHNEPMASVNE